MPSSTFLDAYGAGLGTSQQYQTLSQTGDSAAAVGVLNTLFSYGDHAPSITSASSSSVSSSTYVTVGLVLDRNNNISADPLLSGTWAQRQAALEQYSNPADLWATYGANTGDYNTVQGSVPSDALLLANQLGYLSSAQDRTVWATFTVAEFAQFFGLASTDVYVVMPNSNSGQATFVAWAGSLTLPSSVSGLWVDQDVSIVTPTLVNTATVPLTGLPGIGNGANGTPAQTVATPAAVAANYNFPLSADVPTDPIALVENNVNNQAGLFAAYNLYRQQVGLSPVTQAQFQVLSGATDPQGGVIPELTLDISVVAGAVPNSTQLLYSFLNTWPYNANSTPFSAYQQAFFDATNHPSVISSSYPAVGQASAGSVFDWAWQELFKDGALANVSVHMAAGDEGASANFPNGTVNVAHTHSSPFTLLVGGTSIAGLYTAQNDQTIEQMAALAVAGDPATIFPLVAAGLKTLPSNLSAAAPAAMATVLTTMFETVWQSISLESGPPASVSFGSHQTGSGGVATGWSIPAYQQAFGLSTLTNGNRGMPDVAALSSGDTFYAVLAADYVNGTSTTLWHGDGGTSAAAPLWASLTTQFNAVFVDQGLPRLGYYNDLLYTAAVIAPGSFNDVQLGNNDNSYFTSTTPTGYTSSYIPHLYVAGTGEGYSAMPGYDLASGLGTPNGLLLARALSAIAHSQVASITSPSTSPPMLDVDGSGWDSGADQALLFQTMGNGATVHLDLGDHAMLFSSGASASYSWTSRLAQQSLQSDFDPGLVLLFDKQAQGAVSYARVANGETVGVTIDGVAGQATQASLSNPYGFADFFGGGDQVRVARPVAIAETVGGQDDQVAVLRMRQGGENSLQLTVNKVDDLAGTIDGLAPGHPAYAAAAQGRAYLTTSGASTINGPGYGQFGQTMLQGIDAGDIIAMRLDNQTTGAVFWAFANANEVVNGQKVGHLWNYGLNTWGWEDTYGGGDRDYNDLVVQLDFTSASGHHWLV
ncbi:MAG: hypothetical protein HYX38_31870 [Rhodospirillales bacterium]|nr:hypothetical protein [Rhodospirillales bacterium]